MKGASRRHRNSLASHFQEFQSAFFRLQIRKGTVMLKASRTGLLKVHIKNRSFPAKMSRVFIPLISRGLESLVGTAVGRRLLRRIPEKGFSRIVSGIILVMGILLSFSGGRG
jgi:hypothetical protein